LVALGKIAAGGLRSFGCPWRYASPTLGSQASGGACGFSWRLFGGRMKRSLGLRSLITS
jgi:hypothetical protein